MPLLKKSKTVSRLKKTYLSRTYLFIFLIVFASVGYVLYRSFAASTPGLVEAESMSLHTGAKVVNDSSASGGKAVQIKRNKAVSISGSVSSTDKIYSVEVVGKMIACHGNKPTIDVSVSNSSGSISYHNRVASGSWHAYWHTPGQSGEVLSAGTYTIKITGNTYIKRCQSTLFIDFARIYAQPASSSDITVVPSKTSAKLTAKLDNHNIATTYHTEYGETSAYGTKTKEQKMKTQDGVQTVKDNMKKLKMATTYHYTLCTTNSTGTSCSPDATFTTLDKSGKGGGGGGNGGPSNNPSPSPSPSPSCDGAHQHKGKKGNCTCDSGYQWDSSGTTCEQKPPGCTPQTGAGSSGCHLAKCEVFDTNTGQMRLYVWNESRNDYEPAPGNGNSCN